MGRKTRRGYPENYRSYSSLKELRLRNSSVGLRVGPTPPCLPYHCPQSGLVSEERYQDSALLLYRPWVTAVLASSSQVRSHFGANAVMSDVPFQVEWGRNRRASKLPYKVRSQAPPAALTSILNYSTCLSRLMVLPRMSASSLRKVTTIISYLCAKVLAKSGTQSRAPAHVSMFMFIFRCYCVASCESTT